MDEAEVVALLYRGSVSEDDLVRIVLDRTVDSELRDGALNHACMSEEAIEHLLQAAEPLAREHLLHSVEHPAVLARWAGSEAAGDRVAVAFNPHTAAAVIRRLTRDAEDSVRSHAVFNGSLPITDVEGMAKHDPSAVVRDAALMALTTSTGWSLRQGRRWVHHSEES